MNKKAVLKKVATILIISLFVILMIAGCQAENKTLFTAEDNGGSTNLKVDETMKIKLESNPTTGYGWNLSGETDTSVISLVSTDFETSTTDENIVGAGGFDTITFKAAAAGKTTIILTYNRTWEEDVAPAETFELNVTVR